MQVLAISPDRYVEHQNLLKQMHQLRANVFGGRLEWDVTITDGGERDQYDDMNPTYILATFGGNKVVGCARLLPAAGPTMLERTFPQLLADGSLHATSAMIESSRFCVDTTLPAGRGGEPAPPCNTDHVRRNHRMVDGERLRQDRYRHRPAL